MKASELRQKTIEELKSLVKKDRKEYEKLIVDVMLKKEKNFNKTRALKLDIARAMSVISEKVILNKEVK